jgi:hypothetical protein
VGDVAASVAADPRHSRLPRVGGDNGCGVAHRSRRRWDAPKSPLCAGRRQRRPLETPPARFVPASPVARPSSLLRTPLPKMLAARLPARSVATDCSDRRRQAYSGPTYPVAEGRARRVRVPARGGSRAGVPRQIRDPHVGLSVGPWCFELEPDGAGRARDSLWSSRGEAGCSSVSLTWRVTGGMSASCWLLRDGADRGRRLLASIWAAPAGAGAASDTGSVRRPAHRHEPAATRGRRRPPGRWCLVRSRTR